MAVQPGCVLCTYHGHCLHLQFIYTQFVYLDLYYICSIYFIVALHHSFFVTNQAIKQILICISPHSEYTFDPPIFNFRNRSLFKFLQFLSPAHVRALHSAGVLIRSITAVCRNTGESFTTLFNLQILWNPSVQHMCQTPSVGEAQHCKDELTHLI